ncbi:hypothetical protein HJ526_12965 [Donghicola sp. C2-DW-16]|uniref:Uncharacterized protein n=1 Tax=Donghicola mangrovi TaxID=2729614 RepID=A0A850QBI6_9RHOB|nr:hypothetical protein [Donghicola mangrovi]NVO24210.1 hypothetical protein [Donghicola mangrovi]NVO28338.1 hypothetical protein [Donghicola mangrovi]
MKKDSEPQNPKKYKDPSREDRLKAALKANMAKRKAQAKARKDSSEQDKEES